MQWLPPDEAKYWRTLLDGPQPVNHVLLISTCRVPPDQTKPASSLSLSPSTTNIHVPPLTDEGVHALLMATFRDRLASSHVLANFLHAETAGLSLYVRAMIATLVKESVIFFDYDALTWRFDGVQLQKHLSKAGIDTYLERMIKSLSAPAQELLYVSQTELKIAGLLIFSTSRVCLKDGSRLRSCKNCSRNRKRRLRNSRLLALPRPPCLSETTKELPSRTTARNQWRIDLFPLTGQAPSISGCLLSCGIHDSRKTTSMTQQIMRSKRKSSGSACKTKRIT